ncbi:MAG: T9SS type A sorting domain-containing protein [Paludibacteraceae bacterium]|nr:T9SS type A sorting domain-containing protein [Paludibacteraceae bacterium]MBR2262227.1 T9SS type A sorting domain-containing protein [Paludibacteraceae bacterium]
MKKTFLLKNVFSSLALLTCVSTAVHAESLIVEQFKENSQQTETTSYDLGDKPILTFSGTNLVVKTDRASAEFELSKVVKYYFAESVPTSAKEISETPMSYVYLTEEAIHLRKFEPQLPVYLYSVSGQLILTKQTSNEGDLDLTLSNLAKDVYIIKINNNTIKFINK